MPAREGKARSSIIGRTSISHARAALALVAALMSPQNALAQVDRAEALFQEGRDLVGQRRFAEACPKLEEAYALDHGQGTLLALAICHESNAKPATALRELREALSGALRANRPDRVMLAESHIQELERSVPRVQVRPPVPEPPEFAVTLDGVSVDRASFAAGVPVDPGDHEIVAQGRDFPTWATTVRLTNSSTPALVQVPAPAAGPTRQGPSTERPSSSLRALGWTVTGIGGASVAAGGVFGVLAIDSNSRSNAECRDRLCSERGVELNRDAGRQATVSNVLFAAGGVALAVGIYLLVQSSRSGRSPAQAVLPPRPPLPF